MKKIIFLTIFSLICKPLLAYELEEYISVLQWEEKWNKVTTQAADGFVERGKAYYPESFNLTQTEQASSQIRSSIVQRIGWEAMRELIVSEFKGNCGDELLDVMVEIYAGVEFAAEDRDFIASEYGTCATLSMQNAMNAVYEKMSDFTNEEQVILSEVSSK